MKSRRYAFLILVLSFLLGGVAHADVDCWVTINENNFQDSDCDGIIDKVDSCPLPDKKDEGGNALDTDDDGVQDACDNCPMVSNPEKLNPNSDASKKYWQPDVDGDGVGDICDNCPKTPNPDQKDSNSDGIGDACGCSPDEESNPMTAGPKDQCQSATVLLEYGCEKSVLFNIPPIDCTLYSNYQQNGLCENGACTLKPKKEGRGNETSLPAKKDTDKDGIPDDEDNCWLKHNPDQKDSNGDGIGDACTPKDDGKDGGGSLPGSKGKSADQDKGPKCQEDPPYKHSDIALASATTMNLFAVTRISTESAIVDIAAGEGGNLFWRKLSKSAKSAGWKKIPNPWDDLPQIMITDAAGYKRDITALWSSGTTVFATTAGGYLFKTTVDANKPENSLWQIMGPDGEGETTALGDALYAVHGLSADDFWVAGRNGALWHYVDGAWISPKEESLIKKSTCQISRWEQMWMNPRGSFRRALPKCPNVFDFSKFDTTTWRGIRALADGRLWVVGDEGKILYRTAEGGWQEKSLARSKPDLRTVWADSKELYIGGEEGRIFCNPQSITACTQLDPTATILSIGGDNANQLVAVGTRGLIATKTVGDPKTWKVQKIPTPNSLTAVATAFDKSVITGVNGVIYDFDSSGLSSSMLMLNAVAHPEWTTTQWSAMDGKIDTSGNIEGQLFLAGDDLAIVALDTASGWKWELLYSDDEFVPFTSFYSMPHLTIRDMMRVGTEVYAVGNFDFFVKGGYATPWQRRLYAAKQDVVDSMPPLYGAQPKKIPNMKSVRQGPAKTVLMAGNLGVFQYDPKTEFVIKLQGGSKNGAVATTYNEDPIWALTDGLDGGLKAPWNGVPNLLPEDIATSKDTIDVIGQKAASSQFSQFNQFDQMAQSLPLPWYYLAYQDGSWQNESYLLPPSTGLRRLKAFDATVYIMPGSPTKLQGVAILGDHELVTIATGGGALCQLGYKPNSGDAWWDGDYNYKYKLDKGLTEVTAQFHIYVLGVGLHNRVQKFMYDYQCTISYKDVLLSFFGFGG